jgi:hypothetical protein
MKYLLFICSLSLLAGIVNAQDKDEAIFPAKPGLILGTAITTLQEPEAGPSLSVEYRITKGLAIGIEGTVFLYTLPETFVQQHSRSGFRIRPEIKFFPNLGQGEKKNLYFSLMYVYKRVGYYDNAYFDGLPVRKTKTVYAISPNVGLQCFLERSHHFILDMYAGLGLRRRKTESEEGYQEYDATDGFVILDGDGYNPHLALGFKLGYRF